MPSSTEVTIGEKKLISKAGLLALVCVVLAIYIGALALADAKAEAVDLQRCHSVTAQTYNRQVVKLERIERQNADLPDRKHKKATRKVCKHTIYKRVKDRIKQVCRPIHEVSGRVSHFNDSTTATGLSAATHEGLAVNLNPGTDAGYLAPVRRGWTVRSPILLVKLLGRSRITRIVDSGPAGFTRRALDFSWPLLRAMGWSPGNFPTDAWGHLYRIRFGCR